MHARVVIPEQPIEDFVLGLTNGFKACSVQPFYFQRGKQCLAGRVIPAVALAANRSGDAALLKQLAKLMAGVPIWRVYLAWAGAIV